MFRHGELTGEIIQAFYAVYNRLGYGFLEKVYENALIVELQSRGFQVEQQVPINVYYNAVVVGEYFADLLVNGCVIVEIKALEKLCEEHSAQLINYLKATTIEVGLLFNFGPQPETKRKIFDNFRKPTPLNNP
ncbi:MAG TPA: GxxExxY protein [Abditibacteriaceae bacterium]|jgi:GxxExxY protein